MNVPVAAFRQFLSAASPAKFERIVFQNCGLLDAAATEAIGFLRKASTGEWKLKCVQLPDNEINSERLAQTDDLVRLRGAVEVEEEEEKEENVELVSIQTKIDEVPEAELSDDPFAENQNLHDEFAALLRAVCYSDEVFLVGPAAAASLKTIRKCERIVGEH
jgi:hypothetical protein